LNCSEEEIRKAFTGLCEATKPGGLIILDHRNFLPVLKRGSFNKNGSNPFLKVSIQEKTAYAQI